MSVFVLSSFPPPFSSLPSSFSLDLLCICPSMSAPLSKLNSPLSTLEKESLPLLSLLVRLKERGDRKENPDLNIVIAPPESLIVRVSFLLRTGNPAPKQLRSRCLAESEDDDAKES
jgi:hypothetical protein